MSVSTFLNGRVPTQLRGLNWLALSDSGRVLSSGGTDDGGGGIRGTYTAGSYFPCRIDPIGTSGRGATRGGVIADQINERSTCVITVPPGTSVFPTAHFEITGRGTYEITAVRTPATAGGDVRELEAIEA